MSRCVYRDIFPTGLVFQVDLSSLAPLPAGRSKCVLNKDVLRFLAYGGEKGLIWDPERGLIAQSFDTISFISRKEDEKAYDRAHTRGERYTHCVCQIDSVYLNSYYNRQRVSGSCRGLFQFLCHLHFKITGLARFSRAIL